MAPTFTFPAPVLSVAPEAVRKLEGGEALTGLWTLFTKCKASLKDGHRLENISWRLWYREMTVTVPHRDPEKASWSDESFLDEKNEKQAPFDASEASPTSDQRPTTSSFSSPTSVALNVPEISESHSRPQSRTSVSSSRPPSLAVARRNSFVGTMIVDMLPHAHPPTSPPAALQQISNSTTTLSACPSTALILHHSNPSSPERPQRCYIPTPASSEQRSVSPCLLPTPAAEVDDPAAPTTAIPAADILPLVHVAEPSTPPPPPPHPSHPPSLPRLVVVHPTPGPTPHPTPPATPIFNGMERPPLHAMSGAPDALLPPPTAADTSLSGTGSGSGVDEGRTTSGSGSGSGSPSSPSSSSSTSTTTSSITLSEDPATQQQQPQPPSPTSTAVTIWTDSSKGKEDVSTAMLMPMPPRPVPPPALKRRTSTSSAGRRHLSPDSAIAGPSRTAGPLRAPRHVRRTSSGSSAGGTNAPGRTEERNANTNTNKGKSKSTSRSRSRGAEGVQRVGLTMTTTNTAAATTRKSTVGVGKARATLGGGLRRTASGRGTAGKEREREREKRPTFNIGSHSDEGSALGSKSAGSGSSVSGPLTGTGRGGYQQPLPGKNAGAPAAGSAVRQQPPQQVQPKPQPPPSATTHPAAALPEPTTVLPPPQQRRTTIVLATSESDYETETDTESESDDGRRGGVVQAQDDGDGDWSSEEDMSNGDVEVVVRRGGGQVPPPTTNKSKQALGATQHHQQQQANTRGHNNVHNHVAPAHHPQQQQQQPHISRAQQSRQAQAARAQYVVEQAALEAERLRDMFSKKPLPSAEQLAGKRTRSVGLLTQLMNPDPTIFPPQHPYRRGYSYGEIKSGVTGAGVGGGMGVNGSGRGSGSGGGGGERRVGGAIGAPGLRMSKSSAAIAVTSQVQVGSVASVAMNGFGPGPSAAPAVVNGSTGSGGYRPRGRPADQEMEDDSDDGSESGGDAILVSKSVAQEKLKALAQRRGIAPHERREVHAEQEEREPVPEWLREPEAPTRGLSSRHQQQQQLQLQLQQHHEHHEQQHVRHTTPTPIPVGHPYNLPPPAPPSTPRTTRRLMLQTEMSESLRRNLLWERQVSKVNLVGFRRSSSGGGGGRGGTVLGGPLRPLTALPSMVQLTAKQPGANEASGSGQERERERERERRGSNGDERSREERSSRALARNRSWANEFHHAGW